jgi:hypothetical protein
MEPSLNIGMEKFNHVKQNDMASISWLHMIDGSLVQWEQLGSESGDCCGFIAAAVSLPQCCPIPLSNILYLVSCQ